MRFFKTAFFKHIRVLIALCAMAPGLSACLSPDKKSFSEAEWSQKVEETGVHDLYAPHLKDGRFFSPWMKAGDKSFWDVLFWKITAQKNYTPTQEAFLPRVLENTAERIARTRGDFILWIGHNTFLIRIGATWWLTDPIFSKRALVPPRETPPALTLEAFNELAREVEDIRVVISHNHYDHLDAPTLKKLPRHCRFYTPLGLGDYIRDMGQSRVTEMDWWEEIDLGNGSRLICLPAQHWSLRIGMKRNASLWASFLLITPQTTLYFGGDSGYFKGFREIGRKYPAIDYAFMAVTAYHPRWFMHVHHMNVPEAAKAFDELGARFFIPTQWGTFRLGNEPAGYPGLDLRRHIDKNREDPSRFKIMDIGRIIPIQKGHSHSKKTFPFKKTIKRRESS
ncbi:conserved exported hypothetical protein [Candidatus Desulfarcum epimagneticum]|uniref:Metallo-beta-lactamase domain-containing protein n=1 Tax=uncultured Desulfobacteraceae bacterium TaxID=218296 RepID=A0A484HJC4_9BACT|nr:conserved exported hypothetical protein [uncultured Desulfobacteraceae bacterium]